MMTDHKRRNLLIALCLCGAIVLAQDEDEEEIPLFSELPVELRPQVITEWWTRSCYDTEVASLDNQIRLVCSSVVSLQWVCQEGELWSDCRVRMMRYGVLEPLEAQLKSWEAIAEERRVAIQQMAPALEYWRTIGQECLDGEG